MKKLLSLLAVVVLTAVSAQAQWVWESFNDGLSDDTTYFSPIRDTGYFTNGDSSYCILKDTSDALHGNGAMKINYKVEAQDGWGGYVVRLHKSDIENLGDSAKWDLSSGKYLSFWMKVVKEPTKSQSGDINFEFKLKEQKDFDTGEDLWLKNFGTIVEQPAGTWRQYIVPLEINSVNPDGFGAQFANGDGEFQPWDIVGYEFAIVYITDGGTPKSPVAMGEVILDKLQILDQRYQPVLTLDNQSDTTKDRTVKDAFWRLDDMSWDANAGARKFIMSNEAVDTVEGEGALKIEYAVVGSQDWGGYVQVDHIFETPVDLSGNTKLGFYMKNVVPTELKNRTIMRVDLYDVVDNVYEGWTAVPNVSFDEAWDWDFVQLTLDEGTKGWWEMLPGDVGFSKNDGTNDSKFNPGAIGKIRIQVIVLRTAPEPFGPEVVSSGTFLLDLFTPGGFKDLDVTAPDAPGGIDALALEGVNTVFWDDIDEENQNEKYDVYYSLQPFTSVEDPNVHTLAKGILRGVSSVNHFVNSPLTSRDLSYYYAVVATDKAGNISEPGFSAKTEAVTARAVPVVWLGAPENFAADGNLTEWASLPKWSVKLSDNTGNQVNPATWPLDGDDDLWFEAYAAITETDMYFAIQVYDDLVYSDTTKDSYNQDAPDLFFGLYDYKGRDHAGYRRGETPDYHFRFNPHRVSDDLNGATVARNTSDDYEWKLTNNGYICEWKISLEALAALHEDDVVFTPKEGMMIAFDWLVNDGDATNAREGAMRWSKYSNEDNGWNNVGSWFYTWIGDNDSQYYTDVNSNDGIAADFTLYQNYPNPFNPSTAIRFNMKDAGNVSVEVFDVLGRHIETLHQGFKSQGTHTVQFNAVNLTSGVYFVKMRTGNFTSVRKMMLLK